ncbi:bifunctional polynucleotide phosphatase/kinase [Plasmodium cynomolgi strain B]|uniref:Bifunctional polynucleotide phosphatase/kinase n=1 Tax=Plasmodium cynomolgi (strain B) TaxID=1120755 RepID=K6UKV4_PLACD|nr:bifunctional polynucleotide phosphatase/kinase [Plasmodium cynomolgi strain B]GAB67153.1 bifunctional polynucleotide phosphatase/kinase [Plasmodium cynomolgi strain B]
MQNNKAQIDEIIYVGDNANRIYDDHFKTKFINHLKCVYSQNKVNINIGEIAKRLKKDYTDTDLKFALNINATFYTPEELFLNIKNNLSAEFPFNPCSLLKNVDNKPNEQDAQNFVNINLEELKTKNKHIDMIRQTITSGKNVIMDNANMYVKNRLIYITEAKKINPNLRVSAIFFQYSKELVFHLNNFKMITDEENIMHEVPTIAIHSFYKYVQVPSESENFDRVVTLHDEHFVPSDLQNEERRKLFFSYLY